MINPHEADLLLLDPTGNLAIRIQAMRKQIIFKRLPPIRGLRRPSLSTNRTQHASPTSAIMLLIAWYFKALDPLIPIEP